ncbi:uncharacterized protein N7482_000598 [Penicillium canariense]|uniref:Uncharacterized protein n=1 Tax=Penicillium canariense TaxID=189055 RepID=A0A9W9IFN6_9EURO|nr:uncharacterized protein N7482_000598 [Penicillium canariense]KAJ5174721.1 hypothetical protein N7482_000598 [Penicillium canariense]
MAPLRRYLRISKYSVIECRIYLDNPSDSRWLLNPRDPVLPRVFAAIRPLVLPKLREENERLWARKKSKPVKDVIAEGEFEVAIFLRESRTRHALLTRNKVFHEPGKTTDKPKSKSGKGLANDSADPVNPADAEVIIDSDSEVEVNLRNIPVAIEDNNESEAVLLSDSGNEAQTGQVDIEELTEEEEKKKLRFSTHYESFNITGWVLCLLITRKGDRTQVNAAASEPKQPLMEDWISSQAQTGLDED